MCLFNIQHLHRDYFIKLNLSTTILQVHWSTLCWIIPIFSYNPLADKKTGAGNYIAFPFYLSKCKIKIK